MAALEIWCEPFASVWPEVQELGQQHFDEVDGGVEPKRRFALDAPALHDMSKRGILVILTARLDGRLAGYFTWNVLPDVESAGLLVAYQGAWFVSPSAPNKTARMLWDRSVAELKLAGVQNIFPHHRTQGRGAGLGKFFTRRGAKAIQTTYSLWIGD
jgi:hypothetical protein